MCPAASRYRSWLDVVDFAATDCRRLPPPVPLSGPTVCAAIETLEEPGWRSSEGSCNGGSAVYQLRMPDPTDELLAREALAGSKEAASELFRAIGQRLDELLTNHHQPRGGGRRGLGRLPTPSLRRTAARTRVRGPRRDSFPKLDLPLTLSGAQLRRGWEAQPAPNIPEYVIWGWIKGQFVDVRLYFGTQMPRETMLANANTELARLQIPERS
jgi:hypothetical protein